MEKKEAEVSYIKRDGASDKPWCIYSEGGEKLECHATRKEADDRLAQIEQIKHTKSDGSIEAAKASCYCITCGAYFKTRKATCDLDTCPKCGSEDVVEVTGALE